MKRIFTCSIILAFSILSNLLTAQLYNIDEGYLTDFYYEGFNENTLIFSAPFLRKSSDARSGGLGEIGIASSPDANSMH